MPISILRLTKLDQNDIFKGSVSMEFLKMPSKNSDELASNRSAYGYVPARLVKVEQDDCAIAWGDLKLVACLPNPQDWMAARNRSNYSSLQLDHFHYALLNGTAEDRLHGLCSVVFWGFISGTNGRININRAIERTLWLVRGRKKAVPQSVVQISRHLDQAARFLCDGSVGEALLEILQIKFLGLSFASKVLMFMDPSRAVVYDDVIASNLEKESDLELRKIAIDVRGTQKAKAYAYSQWCGYCVEVAGRLNESGTHWTDWNGATEAWRAVDVERALFALGRPKSE
jgi:hypothetical protein